MDLSTTSVKEGKGRNTQEELAAFEALGEAGRTAGYLVAPFLAYRLSVGAARGSSARTTATTTTGK
jgi:hypothetical protein